MRLTNKTDIFFDLDHTLWDFEKNSALTFELILEKHRIDVDFDQFIKTYVPINTAYWKRFRDGEIDQAQLRYGRFREAFDVVGTFVDDKTITLLSQDYITQLPLNNHLYDGAAEILDYLKAKYNLHIITNGFNQVQAGKLKNSGIAKYFATVTDSEVAGCKKPHAGIYEFAMAVSGAEKAKAVMIGDCIEADVQGALDFGLDAIYFNEFGLNAPSTVKQVKHLVELKNYL